MKDNAGEAVDLIPTRTGQGAAPQGDARRAKSSELCPITPLIRAELADCMHVLMGKDRPCAA